MIIDIKITGSGTPEEVIKNLRHVLETLEIGSEAYTKMGNKGAFDLILETAILRTKILKSKD